MMVTQLSLHDMRLSVTRGLKFRKPISAYHPRTLFTTTVLRYETLYDEGKYKYVCDRRAANARCGPA